MEVTIKNYRCFPDSDPVRLSLAPGVTSFVGVNNAGKSSLLKFFFEFRSLFERLARHSDIFEALRGNAIQLDIPSSTFDYEELFNNSNQRDLSIEIDLRNDYPESRNPASITRATLSVSRKGNQFRGQFANGSNEIAPNEGYVLDGTRVVRQGTLIADLEPFSTAIRTLSSTSYIGAFRNVLNVAPAQEYFDIRIGQTFVNDWRQLKTGKGKAGARKAAQITEDIRRIFGYETLDINASADGDTLLVVVNGNPFMLPELGSGLAQFILVFTNVATRQSDFILIDEPELNLHPSLQMDFLTSLGALSGVGVLFATHSLGLALSSSDRVYSVRKVAESHSTVSPFEAVPSLAEFLGELSYSGYRELGYDRVVLVEGPKDVRVMQQWLRLVRKSHETVILHLGGDSLINAQSEHELAEMTKLSSNIHALIDSERSAASEALAPHRDAFVKICSKIGIKCTVLKRRAIENYFPDHAVKAAKGSKYSALGPYALLANAQMPWAKAENWKIARHMTSADVTGTELGTFLESL